MIESEYWIKIARNVTNTLNANVASYMSDV